MDNWPDTYGLAVPFLLQICSTGGMITPPTGMVPLKMTELCALIFADPLGRHSNSLNMLLTAGEK